MADLPADLIMPQLMQALAHRADRRAESALETAYDGIARLFKPDSSDPTGRGPDELKAIHESVMALKPALAKQYAEDAEVLVYKSLLAAASGEEA